MFTVKYQKSFSSVHTNFNGTSGNPKNLGLNPFRGGVFCQGIYENQKHLTWENDVL